MAKTPPVDPPETLVYDGSNHDQVLDFLRAETPLNPILRGGVILDPAPGEVVSIEVEYADGSSLKLTEGDTLTRDLATISGVTGGVVTPPLPVSETPA